MQIVGTTAGVTNDYKLGGRALRSTEATANPTLGVPPGSGKNRVWPNLRRVAGSELSFRRQPPFAALSRLSPLYTTIYNGGCVRLEQPGWPVFCRIACLRLILATPCRSLRPRGLSCLLVGCLLGDRIMATVGELKGQLAEKIADYKPADKECQLISVAHEAGVRPLHLIHASVNWLWDSNPELAADLYAVLEKHGHIKDGMFVR